MSAPELVLASTSPHRRALLDRLGLPYRVVAPDVDELAARTPGASAEAVTLALARAKAESAATRAPAAFVLGADQLLDLDGELIGKPGTAERAVAQLERLAGRVHRIVTAVALRYPDGRLDSHVDIHRMHMRALARDRLAAYVAADRPLDCAGSYKIEGLGLALFEAVEGRDYTGVIGLPLCAVTGMLERAGIRVAGVQ